MVERIYGWKRDIPDFRDYEYRSSRTSPIPEKVNLTDLICLNDKMSPVEDQGQLGSCTANAAVGALEYLELLAMANDPTKTLTFEDLSRLYIYYQTRAIEHTIREDSGASIRDTVKAIAKKGVCAESLWKYDIKKFKTKPPETCDEDAVGHKISSYFKVKSVTGIKEAIADGYPVIIGIAVYDSFESDKTFNTGVVNIPKRGESLLGGHAILLTGYNDKTGRFDFRNSWGAEFGNGGYGTIPYLYISTLGDDFWLIKK